MTSARRHVSAPHHRAISLLETTIAVGILGVGLIMVAAVFPVALSQHRDTTDQVRAIELASKAQAMLQGRVDHTRLWVPSGLSAGQDTPMYLLPSTNLAYNANLWDGMPALALPSYPAATPTSYANVIDGVTDTDLTQVRENPDVFTLLRNPGLSVSFLSGLDTLSDRLAPFSGGAVLPPSPFTDAEFANAPYRLAWYGFYRRLGGKFAFCAAVCRQQHDQLFVEQDLSAAAIDTALVSQAQNPYSTPTAVLGAGLAGARRLPVPWRISVGYAAPNVLFNTQTAGPPLMIGAGLPLGRLAPQGSKILIQGTVRDSSAVAPNIAVPTGRILTVADVLYDAAGNPTLVEIAEDITELPPFNYAVGQTVTFDVWLFPPAISSGEFERGSPLIAWKTLL